MSTPWMPLYVADYLADTAHLSAAEHGAYLLLIMHYWRVGKLPTDERQLLRIARMTPRQWGESRAIIASFFNENWTHDRIENELIKSRKKTTVRSEAGSRGGRAKALKNNDPSLANATILPEQNSKQNSTLALASSSQSYRDISSLQSDISKTYKKPTSENPPVEAKKPKKQDELPDDVIVDRLAPWVQGDIARAFISNRRRLKCSHSEIAIKLLCAELAKCRDPTACVEKAILSNWKTVYPERDDGQLNHFGSSRSTAYAENTGRDQSRPRGIVDATMQALAHIERKKHIPR